MRLVNVEQLVEQAFPIEDPVDGTPASVVSVEDIREAPAVKAIPVKVVEKYLEGLLEEWDRLGDRKYELPNMQVYNHVRSMMDDLQGYCDREFKPLLDSQIRETESRMTDRQADETMKCRVVFRRVLCTHGTSLPEFDVIFDVKPEDHKGRVEDFLLNVDERIAAYDRAVKVVGEIGISDYVIDSAELMVAPKEQAKDISGACRRGERN